MNKEVLEVLIAGGWFSDRRIDVALISKEIESDGYPILPKVIDFLSSFEGLSFTFLNKRRQKKDDFDFCFKKATHIEVPERLTEDYEPRIGKKMCLIGSAYREHFVLLMAEDGVVYGGYDDFLVKIGNNGIQAIESIIMDYDFEEIPRQNP